MATDTADRREAHIRGLTVTALASTAGILAALASSALVGDAYGSSLATAIVAAAVLAQFPLLRGVGVDVADFGAKDVLYVAFMTFSLWFVCWAILLTTGVEL